MKYSEENAKFMIEHTGHSPILNETGDVVGISSPVYSAYLDGLEKLANGNISEQEINELITNSRILLIEQLRRAGIK